jgi:hypothetical protein
MHLYTQYIVACRTVFAGLGDRTQRNLVDLTDIRIQDTIEGAGIVIESAAEGFAFVILGIEMHCLMQGS